MSRFALALLVCLLPACGMGPAGPAGSDGATGQQGPAGADGAPGKDAAQDGSRLTARWLNGEDGSRQFNGDWMDTEREEVCSFRPHEGEILCLPPIIDRTEPKAWVDPDCGGDFGDMRTYAPASLPEGTSVVRLLSDDPALHHALLMRAEEVPSLYHRGPGGDGPCEPFVVTPDGAFQPPFHRWPLFDSAAFVAGTVE